MDFWRTILKMKPAGERKPDFERFQRAVTTNEPGPVTVGDIFADFETVGNFLRERVLDWAVFAEDPDRKVTLSDLWGGYKYVRQTIRTLAETGSENLR